MGGPINCHKCGPIKSVVERNPSAVVNSMIWSDTHSRYIEYSFKREHDPEDIVLECGKCGEMLDHETTEEYLLLKNKHPEEPIK